MVRRNGSSLDDLGQAQQIAWVRACREVSARGVNARCRVARTLGECGVTAIEPLCGALFDPELKARRAAARSLGAIGDPRAVPALRRALQGTMLGGGATAHRMTGWSILVFIGIAELAFMLQPLIQEHHRSLAVCGLFLWLTVSLGVIWTRWRADNLAELRLTLVTALSDIAVCDGGPDARASLPELDALSQTPFGRTAEGRKQLRHALEVIRSLPEFMPLPIPAAREDVGTSDLPIAPESLGSAAQRLLLPVPADPR
jgi:hypothetical protein